MGTITVKNLGKAYKQYKTHWSRLADWILPGKRQYFDLKWILQDVNFSVQAGEAVGIIGINGAGKSTLLKMITGTTLPTTGTIDISGRIAALLELGIGFHSDFTGRQNVYMAGQLMGYSVDEIAQLMPEIEAFAEIGTYIDMPVRVYSSGMQMRLAFSVATAKRPEVLIIDEALSVGDAYFQHKSFDRIREFNSQGTTLLIVSHDKSAIQSICDRAILLNAGKVAMEGAPEAVMDYYNALLSDKEKQTVTQERNSEGKIQTISGSREVTIANVELLNQEGVSSEIVNVGQAVRLRIRLQTHSEIPELVVGYMIKDRLGQVIFGTNSYHLKRILHKLPANQALEYVYDFTANLGEGTYSISISVHSSDTHIAKNYEWRDLALVFNVVNSDKESFIGTSWLPPTLEIKQ
ncbi:ABC transporter ATP-binding protein [Advenella mimigardefordensis]|uniref:Putative O-antigen export system ATP-binding protein RfbB n=1 Tax=Advenella mimigardefordensis (strain DSM 17166 / LMG 22922 / DPN7) TaxID=1247726 RepID=W0PBK3_ADVMD|nr:ABC transporter ATP-binding protein [Advenella mimigardefordensis]AHG62790.1 putative O-antigen export system ATP-binding protein RfbB [Advenella mimigardefordensis DPN7]